MTRARVDRWRPELRRAVMKVRPEFFTWPDEQRERYGVDMPPQDQDRLNSVLQQELFGRKSAADIPVDEKNYWNETLLPLIGIGEDCFYLNEWLGDGKTILDFPTLHAYDEEDYVFQEGARKQEDAAYRGKPYRGNLYLNWARLFVDKKFTYATLSMAAGHIYAQLEETAFNVVNETIPHRYVPGRNHGKTEGAGRQWDLRVDAGGQEALLEELQRQISDYTCRRYDSLLSRWDRRRKCGVYQIDASTSSESHLHFVFTDKRSLGAVRCRSFLRDCRAIERPVEELALAADKEKSALVSFIRRKRDELARTLDPAVTRLRRRRKIIVHKGVFDDLDN